MSITIDDLKKIDLRVGKVIEAKRVEGTDKLLLLKVNLGGEVRNIVTGIGDQYEPEYLLGRNVVVVANLKPRVIRGVESQGMILCAVDEEENVFPITTLGDAKEGSKVY
ncbi:MAG TPA: methionine--tRNA ligase subunit beta [Geobacterales bacterium]|nr:methionine--tRNA ligase subunit beta [Geobacterales bacterium]